MESYTFSKVEGFACIFWNTQYPFLHLWFQRPLCISVISNDPMRTVIKEAAANWQKLTEKLYHDEKDDDAT